MGTLEDLKKLWSKYESYDEDKAAKDSEINKIRDQKIRDHNHGPSRRRQEIEEAVNNERYDPADPKKCCWENSKIRSWRYRLAEIHAVEEPSPLTTVLLTAGALFLGVVGLFCVLKRCFQKRSEYDD